MSAIRVSAAPPSTRSSSASASSTCSSTMPPSSIRRRRSSEITPDQLERTFRTNIFGYFYMTQAAMPHLKKGAAIINTTSVTAYRGSPGSARLQRHQRRHRRLHALAGAEARERGHPRQRRGAGADLDAADPIDLPGREGEAVRCEHADEASRPAERGGAVIPVPGLRGFVLHHAARSCIRTAARRRRPDNKKGGSNEPPLLAGAESFSAGDARARERELCEGAVATAKNSMTAEREPPIKKRTSAISTCDATSGDRGEAR